MPRLFVRNKSVLVIIVILTAVVLFSFIPPISKGIKKLSINILSFPARTFSNVAQYFQSKHHLEEETRRLEKEVSDLALDISQFRELRGENERLRELLKFKKRIRFETISAEIIARNPNDWLGSFIVNKGFEDGVQRNSAVCSARGLIGKIVEPEDKISSVMLITHPSFKAGGMLKRTRINGIVVGSGKDIVKMIYIPIDAEVKKNETVITSGFSRIFPKGIIIGNVISVGKSKTGLYKFAIIKPSANPFEQEEVLCIK